MSYAKRSPGLREATDNPVAIVMGEQAAENLAKACAWGSCHAGDALYEDPYETKLTPDQRSRVETAYAWLDWGSRWLVNNGARRRVQRPSEVTIDYLMLRILFVGFLFVGIMFGFLIGILVLV